jgi:3-deoxy-D-manno-octulosonic-acid transferase
MNAAARGQLPSLTYRIMLTSIISRRIVSKPRPSSLLAVYSLLLTASLVATAPVWLLRLASGRYREGLLERLGFVPRRVPPPAPGETVVWLHAVSVGELLAASRLVSELRASGRRVYISTTTRTAQALAREHFGGASTFYYPLDFAFAVRGWLRHLRPDIFILMESEFWPRMLTECARTAIPVVVVNARISDRSWPRYRRLRPLWRRLLAGLAATLAQSPRDAERLAALGAGNITMAGNLKFDVKPPREAPITALLRQHLPPGAKVIVCGSTLEGEEALLLRTLQTAAASMAAPGRIAGSADFCAPAPVLIFAPRHPERFDAVAATLGRGEHPCIRRSTWTPGPIAPGTVFLLDSIGELASVYSLATLACVGGSWFLPGGGHNPLEPAQLGVPVISGPHTANFAAIVELLQAENAIVVAGEAQLGDAILGLLTDGEAARELGSRAQKIAEAQAGATARALAVIERVLTGGAA